MSILRKILLPVSPLYALVIRLRNYFYNQGIFKSRSYEFPVIGVGNLSVGGTGKSPMIEYLLRLLLKKYSVATLSRGYGRRSKGFHLLNSGDKAILVGDEPLQFKNKFAQAHIAVDENRQRGIANLKACCDPDVVLLDDAFQHRKVKAGLYILLTSYGNLYTNDRMLPAGNLREPATGADRAKIIVVTKCPKNLSDKEQMDISLQLNTNKQQHIFFSSIDYSDELYGSNGKFALNNIKGSKVTLVTGIANPEPLKEYLESEDVVYHHLNFPDHHNFSESDLSTISGAPIIITTEKDYMRLKDLISHPALYYLPIRMSLVNQAQEFEKLVMQYVANEK